MSFLPSFASADDAPHATEEHLRPLSISHQIGDGGGLDRDECDCCKYNDTKAAERVAKERAAARAHTLAMKEAEREDARFSFLELYGLFFPKIYTHEYNREWTMEREKQQEAIRLTPGRKLCDYHNEFDDDFCRKVYKQVARDYAKSKWKPTA